MNRSHIIPVYVCSAYRDMQAERAYLHAHVFPPLVASFAARGYHLEIIDPCSQRNEAEAEGLGSLAERLATIERCRPFFIGLFGTRDNRNVPTVPLEVGRRYPHLQHYARSSRLQLETVHGVLRGPQEAWGSFFYCRTGGTPAPDAMERHRLGTFKKALRASGRPVREYDWSWDEQRQQPRLPTQLGEQVTADLLRVLAELPARGYGAPAAKAPARSAAAAQRHAPNGAATPVPEVQASSGRKQRPRTGWNPVRGYRLVEFLGRGGFGEVWKAVGPDGRSVALKFVPLDHPLAHIETRSVRLMKRVRHGNVLSLIGAWRVSGYLVIAMELAERSLMDRFDEARQQGLPGIPVAELHTYMRQVASGIDFLNERQHPCLDGSSAGIQHKDINPHNLLLSGNVAKLADFGLARLQANTVVSASGTMTPAYAAPEFFKGQATRWSDQYSLAVSYCLLRGGRLPFEGRMARVMAGHLKERPDLFGLPSHERSIVARAMAKEPARRWPSCRAFVEALIASSQPKETPKVNRGKGLMLAASLVLGLAAALLGRPRGHSGKP